MAPFTPAVKLTPPTVTVLPASRSVNVTAAFSFNFVADAAKFPKLVVALDVDVAVIVSVPELALAEAHPEVFVPEKVPVDTEALASVNLVANCDAIVAPVVVPVAVKVRPAIVICSPLYKVSDDKLYAFVDADPDPFAT